METQTDFLTRLAVFLCAAREQGYANPDAATVAPTRLGWQHYHFEQDGLAHANGLAYDDEYCGSERFCGSEIISVGGRPVWGMNYYGYVFPLVLERARFTQQEVYDFLKTALRQDTRGIIPIRGPDRFLATGDRLLRYYLRIKDRPYNRLDSFHASEEIKFGGKFLYRADIHGGLIVG